MLLCIYRLEIEIQWELSIFLVVSLISVKKLPAVVGNSEVCFPSIFLRKRC